jgi:hypothetical protein
MRRGRPTSAFDAQQNKKAFYQQANEEVLAALRSTEAQARLAKNGRNELVAEKPVPA